jgi:hypothetical protein
MDERWEYRREMKAALVHEYGDADKALSRLGSEGWELVGIENETVSSVGATGYGGARTQGWSSTTVTYVFKRRRRG